MRVVPLIAANVVVTVLLLALLEGCSSLVLLLRDSRDITAFAERRHTEYDPQLGWVNRRNVYIPDMYGPGIYLRTNSQRIRSDHDFERAVPLGEARIICSGDSFTLGYGVDNDHTWCQLLTTLNPRLETLNLGQGGYGVGQAFLSYERDAAAFDHQLEILAIISDDFNRMPAANLYGYGKPVIKVRDGRLVATNVPVPRPPWPPVHVRRYLRRLNIVQIIDRAVHKLYPAGVGVEEPGMQERDTGVREVLPKLLEELRNLNRQRSSQLVLVFLPMQQELDGAGPEAWRRFVSAQAHSLDIPLIDVFDRFRALSVEDRKDMYIAEGRVPYPGAAGHLTNRGNMFVARAIYEGLMSDAHAARALMGARHH